MRRTNGHTVADECVKIIEETRNTYVKKVMINNVEGYPTITQGGELDLLTRPPLEYADVNRGLEC